MRVSKNGKFRSLASELPGQCLDNGILESGDCNLVQQPQERLPPQGEAARREQSVPGSWLLPGKDLQTSQTRSIPSNNNTPKFPFFN